MGNSFKQIARQRGSGNGGGGGGGKNSFAQIAGHRAIGGKGLPDATAPPAPKKKGGHGLLHSLERYSGAELAGNLAKDVGHNAVGIGPGMFDVGKNIVMPAYEDVRHGPNSKQAQHARKDQTDLAKSVVKGYGDYYGHDIAHHLYKHPLQPLLDALTVLDAGSTAGVRAGLLSADRASLVTRSPRAIATGKGPTHVDISSTKPVVRGREVLANKIRQNHPAGVKGIGGELKRYGKQIQQQANQHALGHLNDYQPYLKATRHLSEREQTALNIRPLDIHPDDLKQLWHGTPAGKLLADPKVEALVLAPSKRMVEAEAAARRLSVAGEKLLKDRKLLKDETADARPALTKKQATERLGRPVRELHGQPYYLPHVLEDGAKPVNPLKSGGGGGKGIPRKLGATKQNTGALAFTGKLHLRSDVLGPEFLRRVKFVKYDEVHNALVRGAIRVTKAQLDEHYGGKLPNGYEYIRTKPGQKIPATMRGEGTDPVAIDKLIPNAEDLHQSQLAKDGFSTEDPGQAHTSGGHFYIVPKQTVKAATGEFTRSSDFVHTFVKKPLSVWRSAVLGLRVGFLTNNLVGNSVMYGVKTGGRGALRDLFMAIRESHGDAVAKKALDSASTPPELRQSLYQEFYPEQMHGTFGKTQSPSTSTLGAAGSKAAAVWRGTTGAIPRVTSAVAETAFRQALIRHSIRHSPEFKKVYAALPKQTRNFETAARRLHEGKGAAAYQRYVSKQVNQALGDYLNLSPFERNVLRNAVPFYSWYRAITTTTGHLAADTPLRANVLGQIGQIGKQWSDNALGDVPSFLEGAIPIGHARAGIQRVLGTQGLNPYSTLEQLYRAATGDLSALGLNPFLQGALDAYARKTGRGGKIGPAQLAEEVLKNIVLGLPPTRLAHPMKPSKLYPNRDRKSEGLSFVGVPIKEYSVPVAAQQKRQGR